MNIYPFNDNSLVYSQKKLIQISDMSEYLTFINCNTKKFKVREDEISKNEFCGHKNLRKVWIPSTCTTIEAPTAKESPFYGCSPYLTIYTDVKQDSIPAGWGEYWNYYSTGETLAVFFSSSLSQYELASILDEE